ncbi:hypothetical protein WDW37_15215 [Bdellovibrionota bacterium FG-1]
MIILLSLLICLVTVDPVHAADQRDSVQIMSGFLGADKPHLYEGHDANGECRVMVYSQNEVEVMRVFLEGTFQIPTGAVLGMVIPFSVSTLAEATLLKAFSCSDGILSAEVTYLTDQGAVDHAIQVKRSSDRTFSEISYRVPAGVYTCQGLKRLL